MTEQSPRLERWHVTIRPVEGSPYDAPELRHPRLVGRIYGDPRHVDGTTVVTSPIVGRSGEWVVTASGSAYSLGEVNPAYEAMFPDARGVLLRGLKHVEPHAASGGDA